MMPPDWVDVISTYLARMHICVIIAETNAVDINQIKENLRTRTRVFLHILLTQSGIFYGKVDIFNIQYIFLAVYVPRKIAHVEDRK